LLDLRELGASAERAGFGRASGGVQRLLVQLERVIAIHPGVMLDHEGGGCPARAVLCPDEGGLAAVYRATVEDLPLGRIEPEIVPDARWVGGSGEQENAADGCAPQAQPLAPAQAGRVGTLELSADRLELGGELDHVDAPFRRWDSEPRARVTRMRAAP